jgi:hypothetical protein
VVDVTGCTTTDCLLQYVVNIINKHKTSARWLQYVFNITDCTTPQCLIQYIFSCQTLDCWTRFVSRITDCTTPVCLLQHALDGAKQLATEVLGDRKDQGQGGACSTTEDTVKLVVGLQYEHTSIETDDADSLLQASHAPPSSLIDKYIDSSQLFRSNDTDTARKNADQGQGKSNTGIGNQTSGEDQQDSTEGSAVDDKISVQ